METLDKENILDKYICRHPFRYLDVNHSGSYMCCPSWLPQDITEQGKFTITEAWDGELANKIRQSVTDGTYKYCDKQLCPALNRLVNTGEPDLDYFVPKEEFDTTDTSVEEILLGQDRSCNLRCPSCRPTVIHNYEGDHEWKEAVQDEIKTSFGGTIKKILMTGSGDPLYSKIYKDFLINFNKKDFPNLIDIQLVTNGNLLNKRMWSKFNCTEYIDTIDFGIDAGTKDTYENITRLGGDWDKLINNIKFLASLDDRTRDFIFSFVVTQYNYKEMSLLHDIIKEIFKNSISGYCMNYRQIAYWGTGAYSEKEVENISVFNPEHAEYQNFIVELKKINNFKQNDDELINHNFHHLFQ